jgi:hypothetical protein
MAMNFPNSPAVGQLYPTAVTAGQPQYRWSGSAWLMLAAVAGILQADTTYYVRTDGNDANNGLANTPAGAFLTIQAALNLVQTINLNGHNVTISVQAGTYTTPVVLLSAFLGAGSVKISGDVVTPANVLVSTSGPAIAVGGSAPPVGTAPTLQLEGLKLTSSGNTNLAATDGAYVFLTGKMDFGASANFHLLATRGGRIMVGAAYNISGPAQYHLRGVNGGQIIYTPSLALTGAVAFSVAFIALIRGSSVALNGVTFGASTAPAQWNLDGCSVLDAGGTVVPGTASGNSVTNNATALQGVTPATGFRNRIINGEFRIDQRFAGNGATSPIAAYGYTVDRWNIYSAGAAVTGSRTPWGPPGGSQYCYQINGVAGNTTVQFTQRIEQANCFDLAGQTITISASLANTLATAGVTWALYYANAADNFGSFTAIGSGGLTLTGSLVRYSWQVAVPAAANTGLWLIFQIANQTSGQFYVGDVQLELGNAATPFERRPIQTELAMCCRYYNKTFAQNQMPASSVSVGQLQTDYPYAAGAPSCVEWYFPTRMRAAPTITTFRPDGAGSGWSGGAATMSTGPTEYGCRLVASGSTAVGVTYTTQLTADAEL